MAIAANAYANPDVGLPPGVTPLDPRSIGLDSNLLTNGPLGFSAALFQHDGVTYVSFRGTDEAVDWATNALQAVGGQSSQYAHTARLATAITSATGGHVLFVGHSLGGGLASLAAISTGMSAVTFNAAGLHPSTIANYQLAEANPSQLVTAYYVVGEILSLAQDVTRLPGAIGRRVPVLPRDLRGPLSWHSQRSMLRALER